MPGHNDSEVLLGKLRKTFVSGTGVTTMTAPNNNFSMQELRDLIISCEANGQEIVVTAGALKIRPANSAL
jgi:hypothetical protein